MFIIKDAAGRVWATDKNQKEPGYRMTHEPAKISKIKNKKAAEQAAKRISKLIGDTTVQAVELSRG